MSENKTNKETDERDDIEKFLAGQKTETAAELKEIQDELKRLYRVLAVYLESMDREIQIAFEKGDDNAWLSLTNKKNILLQRINELDIIIKK